MVLQNWVLAKSLTNSRARLLVLTISLEITSRKEVLQRIHCAKLVRYAPTICLSVAEDNAVPKDGIERLEDLGRIAHSQTEAAYVVRKVRECVNLRLHGDLRGIDRIKRIENVCDQDLEILLYIYRSDTDYRA
jgi:hypothetical protein